MNSSKSPTIRGCKVKETPKGFVVGHTVFKNRGNAELFAFYLRIVKNNKGKIVYVKSLEEALELYFSENQHYDNPVWKSYLTTCWKQNEECYLNLRTMYVLDNLQTVES